MPRRKPNSPRTARRIASARQQIEQSTARSLQLLQQRAQHRFRLQLRSLRPSPPSIREANKKRAQKARQDELAKRRRMTMNIMLLKSIIGNFNGHSNMRHKVYLYKIGSVLYGNRVYNVDPRVNNLAARVYAHLYRKHQQAVMRVNAAVAQMEAQVAALQSQIQAVSATRPRVYT